jgi:Cryptococcal mannosyltransferase 1
VAIRTSMRTRGAFNHRIEYLAEVRNSAFVPLHELRDSEGEYFDSIIFMNDVLPCVDDLLELIWQSRRNNAGITCAADYMYHDEMSSPVFYDNWVSRDINGTALENAPFERIFHHMESSVRFQHHLPIQVQSCWNGIAVLDPAPFYSPPHIQFRMARIMDGECSASECSLICNDYWEAGYGRIMMVPRVKLAYDSVSCPQISFSFDFYDPLAESFRYHTSSKTESDGYSGICSFRWSPGRSPYRSARPFMVWPSRSSIYRRRGSACELCVRSRKWLVLFSLFTCYTPHIHPLPISV